VPVVWYVYETREALAFVAAVAATFAVAYLLPPAGWKRPHPYSDNPENRPRTSSKKD